jgi:hypothetical protein
MIRHARRVRARSENGVIFRDVQKLQSLPGRHGARLLNLSLRILTPPRLAFDWARVLALELANRESQSSWRDCREETLTFYRPPAS